MSAVFNTSVTSGVAFLSMFASQIIIIAGFGLYCAIAIFVSYVLTLLVYPSVFSLYYDYFHRKAGCCSCFKSCEALTEDDEEYMAWETDTEKRGESPCFVSYFHCLTSIQIERGRRQYTD